jgi:hypothetical protein
MAKNKICLWYDRDAAFGGADRASCALGTGHMNRGPRGLA